MYVLRLLYLTFVYLFLLCSHWSIIRCVVVLCTPVGHKPVIPINYFQYLIIIINLAENGNHCCVIREMARMRCTLCKLFIVSVLTSNKTFLFFFYDGMVCVCQGKFIFPTKLMNSRYLG